MTFRQFVKNNVLRNKRLYGAYFLSSMFTVMVFFTFANFAFHPTFTGGSINKNAITGMTISGGIIYVFSFFFVLYSMGSFLQSRKKEFGLLMLQGMSMRQVKWMVFLENMFIGIMATVIGISSGLLFSKFILLIAENVLVIDEALPFYFPLWAIVITLGSFLVLFLVISFFVTFLLRSKKLADLIKGSDQEKSEPKASIILALLAAILLIGGYLVALIAKGTSVVMVMLPVILVVIIGTYFFFTQFSVFGIRYLKRRKSFFWKRTNMILLSDLSFRMKDNARSFFMVAIISTVAFSAIGTLFGFKAFINDGFANLKTHSFTYIADEDEEESIKEVSRIVDKRLAKEEMEAKKLEANLSMYESEQGRAIFVIDESTFNGYAALSGEEPILLSKNEMIGVQAERSGIDGYLAYELVDHPVLLANGETKEMTKEIHSNVLSGLDGYYIVPDDFHEQLPEPLRSEGHLVWAVPDGDEDQLIEVGEALIDEIDDYAFQANDVMLYEINKSYGPILFIGLFIGLVFFISAGSFLYFRLYTDLDADKEKFASIAKIGLTDKEVTKVIRRQTMILFFAPIVVALVHGAVALTALSHLFDYSLVRESSIVLGSFLLIQIVYYAVVRYLYTKQIKSVM